VRSEVDVMLLQGERRRTGVTCNGPNIALVVKREILTGSEHYEGGIGGICSLYYGDKKFNYKCV
jgi:hypothetical protein